VHLAIPGGALALIIAWHAARGKGGFGVIGGGGKWGRGCERGAGTGLSRAMGNGKWETECQQFMKWTPHAFPPTLTSIFPPLSARSP